MTCESNDRNRCPLCGGRLVPGQRATIPFVIEGRVIVVKNVPAEVCRNCHEPYLTGLTTDRVMAILRQFRSLPAEVSIVPYPEPPLDKEAESSAATVTVLPAPA